MQAVRVGQWKAHLVTEMPNEPHAGPERGFLVDSGNDHSPYGPQDPWLLFNIDRDPSVSDDVIAYPSSTTELITALSFDLTSFCFQLVHMH